MPIGESDLPHALVWDEIPSATFSGRPLDPQILASLRDASQSRQEHLEEFGYLKKSIAWYKEKQDLKEIPLNLDERRHQKEVDDAFKKTMDTEKDQLAKSDFPYKEFTLVPPVPKPAVAEKKAEAADSEDEGALGTEEDAGITKLDIHLRESLRVLSDALSLSKNPRYWANGSAPLTLQVSKNG
jgi:carboxyl-terminal processing protease